MLCLVLAALAQPSPANWKITGHYRYFGPTGRATREQVSKIFIHSLTPLREGIVVP
jgi:hypothetical protein